MSGSVEPQSLSLLSPRDRVMQARARAMHPRERLDVMQRLIDEAWSVLQKNPAGMQHFLRRNYKARSIARGGDGACHGS
jgi:hypothetical protein